MDAVEVLARLRDIGLLGALIIILFGGFKEWWVWGSQYRAMRQERDYWKDIAFKLEQQVRERKS